MVSRAGFPNFLVSDEPEGLYREGRLSYQSDGRTDNFRLVRHSGAIRNDWASPGQNTSAPTANDAEVEPA